MSIQNKNEYYTTMQKTYMNCIKKALSIALFAAWGEDWYRTLQEIDHTNTLKHNEREKEKSNNAKKEGREYSPYYISDITNKFSNVGDFDFQACNKVIYYLEDVRKLVFLSQNKVEFTGKYRKYFNSLIEFRNNHQGHASYSDEKQDKTEKEYKEAIDTMALILNTIFPDIIDENDKNNRSYRDIFEDAHLGYQIESKKKLYVLSEYLDFKRYDPSKFMDQCTKLGIEADMIEGKYIFYSANLEVDLSKLKNALSINADSTNTPVITNEQNSNKSKTILISFAVLLSILLIVLLAINLMPSEKNSPPVSNDGHQAEPNQTINQTPNSENYQDPLKKEDQEQSVGSATIGKDETTEEYADAIAAFKHSDESTIRLSTIFVEVGGYTTPPAASVWTNAKILSQNTSIAVGEGRMVKGVSTGITYIVIVSETGTSQVSRVVVE